MATLATFWNLFGGTRSAGTTSARVAAPAGSSRLRPTPNEDVYFFVKRIDNSRVVRAANPRAGRRCWKFIGTGGLITLLLIGLFLPSAYGLFLGYDLEELKARQKHLTEERSALELEEARLLAPARLQELARTRELAPPAAGRVVYLSPGSGAEFALNVKSK
jgi:hypothetical protein